MTSVPPSSVPPLSGMSESRRTAGRHDQQQEQEDEDVATTSSSTVSTSLGNEEAVDRLGRGGEAAARGGGGYDEPPSSTTLSSSLRRSSASKKKLQQQQQSPPSLSLAASSPSVRRRRLRLLNLQDRELTIHRLQFGALAQHLYGRDHEVAHLRRCWDGVVVTASVGGGADNARRQRSFVAVRGSSGSGKSALVESLRPLLLQRGQLYLQGKFPQRLVQSRGATQTSTSAGEPYAAFAAACQELCDLALALNDDPNHEPLRSSSNYKDQFRHRKCFSYNLSDLRRTLNRELGKDATILTKVIPGLKQILQIPSSPPSAGTETNAHHEENSDEEGTTTTSPPQARHRFTFAFRKLVRVLATTFGPVAIVLDDLQWADSASLELVEALLTDREASGVLLVGCYRDHGDPPNNHHQQHPDAPPQLMAAIASWRAHAEKDTGLSIEEIQVDNLNPDQVNDLLVDLLSSRRPTTDALADCIHKKTHGNVFFVIQFLTMLQESNMLTYNFGVMGWQWDVAQIQIRTAATENVVGLMCEKMMGLPESIGLALPVLACLGSSFTIPVLDVVARRFQWKDDLPQRHAPTGADGANDGDRNDSANDTEEQPLQGPLTAASVLSFCVDQGLVEEAGAGAGARRYQWVHDKIQEAASTLVSEDELNALKLKLGKILFEDLNEEELERNLFVVTNLLATDSMCDPMSLPRQMPVEVATLYMRAGNKAIEKAAFDQATGYLSAGIALLPPNHWRDHYALTLGLYSSAAEGFFCVGNFEQMSAHCHEVIRQSDVPILDKRRAYIVLIDATGGAGRQREAFELSCDVLAKLGHKFPTRATCWRTWWTIVKIKSTLIRLTSHGLIAKLPTAEDPKKQLVMAVLSKSITWMYITKSDLFPLAVFKGLQMTMSDGVSVHSPVLFALVGLLLSGFYFDFTDAAAFGDQAVDMLKQAKGSRKVESRVHFLVNAFVFCWVRPISLSTKPLLAGYETGMATGDTESASWCIKYYLEYQFRTGMPLEDFVADCAFYAHRVREVKMNSILALLTNLWQTALFLIGTNAFDGTFTGELVSQKALEASGAFHDFLFISIHRTLMYTQFVLGRHDLVYESIKRTDMDKFGFEKCFPGIAGIMHLYAFNGFSMISLYRETSNKRYLRMGMQFALKIKSWTMNPNVTHYNSLFDAEFDSLRGDTYSAAKNYEGAIVYAGRRGLTQDRALAHELFGEHLARLNPVEHGQDAEFQLNESIKLYTEWGAHAKVRLMNEKHSKTLAPPSEKSMQRVKYAIDPGHTGGVQVRPDRGLRRLYFSRSI